MKMCNYQAFGLNISSEIELPGVLKQSSHTETDITILKGSIKRPEKKDNTNYFLRNDDLFLWWDVGQVKVTGGKEVIVDSESIEITPYLLGPVMSILLHQRGYLVLHGSAINYNNNAVAFLGYRGFGKSTTVINLYAQGYPLVADDILAIKFTNHAPIVYPGYYHVRLSDDTYENVKHKTKILSPIKTLAHKNFCDASYKFSSKPIHLSRIYLLDRKNKNEVFNISIQDHLLDLLTHSTANYSFTPEDQAENLKQCVKLINNVEIKGLSVKQSFEDMPDLILKIKKDLKK